MVGVAGTSGGHPGLPLLKQGHHIQAAFEDLQGGDHQLSGQPVPALPHLHSAEAFPDVLVTNPVLWHKAVPR